MINLKKTPFGQNKRCKKYPPFSFASSNSQKLWCFTFNLRFLYDLKNKVRLSKTVCRFFHFWFRCVFIKVYIFVRQNTRTLWLKNAIIPVKINKIERPNIFLLPELWFSSCSKNFWNSIIFAWVPQNWVSSLEFLKSWPGDKFFKSRKLKFWEDLHGNF